MKNKKLRHGFTTGSAAAAGAKAGVLCLGGKTGLKEVEIPLPEHGRLKIPVFHATKSENKAVITIIKDGGDDPDATHKAHIISIVEILSEGNQEEILIQGGKGVGCVTRPGLPLPIGASAINPVPRQQIRDAVKEGLKESGLTGGKLRITIEVANGEKIAKKTLNARLGIIGGISILGTRGTVKPFSNQAYKDTITMSMDVALANDSKKIALTTGGKSENLLKKKLPDLSEQACVQVADFFAFSLQEAVKRKFSCILISCFFGKLVKMAHGYPYTHARKNRIDFKKLAAWCAEYGLEQAMLANIINANTTREALEYILKDRCREKILQGLSNRALASARSFAGLLPDITFYLFDFSGKLLLKTYDKGKRET